MEIRELVSGIFHIGYGVSIANNTIRISQSSPLTSKHGWATCLLRLYRVKTPIA